MLLTWCKALGVDFLGGISDSTRVVSDESESLSELESDDVEFVEAVVEVELSLELEAGIGSSFGDFRGALILFGSGMLSGVSGGIYFLLF